MLQEKKVGRFSVNYGWGCVL